MKAVIVECSKDQAVVLRDDGQFVAIPNRNYAIGQELELNEKPTVIQFAKWASMAASAALVVIAGSGYGVYTWSNPYSYVSLDINPSIEYSLNQYDRVISVNGMNEDGMRIADSISDSVKNTKLTTALEITMEQLVTEAYLQETEENYMVISVYSDNDNKAVNLKSEVDSFKEAEAAVCSINTVNVTKEVKETADSLGISAGKMVLINEYAVATNTTDTVDAKALAEKSVRELEETIASASNSDIAVVSEEVLNDPNAVVSQAKGEEDAALISDSNTSAAKGDENAGIAPASLIGADAVTPAATTGDGMSSPITGPSVVTPQAPTTPSAPSVVTPIVVPEKPQEPSSDDNQGTQKPENENQSEEKGDGFVSSEKKPDDNTSDKKEETSQNTDSEQKTESVSPVVITPVENDLEDIQSEEEKQEKEPPVVVLT